MSFYQDYIEWMQDCKTFGEVSKEFDKRYPPIRTEDDLTETENEVLRIKEPIQR